MSYEVIQESSNRNPKYKCNIYKVKEGEKHSGEVMYYFNGATNVSTDWDTRGWPIAWVESQLFEVAAGGNQRVRKYMGDNQPQYVICYSFDDVWLLSPDENRHKKPRDATFETLLSLISLNEKKHGIVPIDGKRLLMGHSMGGLNAAILMSQPTLRNLWKRVLLHNPMFPTTPFDSKNPGDWIVFGNNWYGGGPTFLAGLQYKEEDYNKIDIIGDSWELVKEIPAEVQIQSSQNDVFQFYARHNELKGIADDEGKRIDIVKNNGGHNYLNAKEAARFLVEGHKPLVEELDMLDEVQDSIVTGLILVEKTILQSIGARTLALETNLAAKIDAAKKELSTEVQNAIAELDRLMKLQEEADEKEPTK